MEGETLKDKTAKGLFWGGLSTLLQQFIGMIFGIVIARILNPDDYGLVAMLAIFSAIANTIMDSGFTTALINRKMIRHGDYNAVFWFSAFCGIVLYVLLFFSAPLIAKFYNQPVLLNLSRVLFLSFLISSFGIAHNALLFKQLKVKQRGIIDITSVIISGLVGLILAISGFAYWGLTIQIVSQSLVSTVLRWSFSKWKPVLSFDFQPIKEMIGFSSKIFCNNILGQVCTNIFSVLLGKHYTVMDTGYYSQGNKWMYLGNTVITGMIQSVAQPILVEATGDKVRMKKIFRKMLRFGAFISFPAMFGLAFVAKEFLLITVGTKWLGSVEYLQLLSIMGAFTFISMLYTNLLFAYGKSGLLLVCNTLIYALYMLLAFLLIPYGISILIGGCVIYSIIVTILIWSKVTYNIIDISFLDLLRDILPYLFLTLGIMAVVYFVTIYIVDIYLLFVSKIILFIMIYFVTLWLTKSVVFYDFVRYINLNRK